MVPTATIERKYCLIAAIMMLVFSAFCCHPTAPPETNATGALSHTADTSGYVVPVAVKQASRFKHPGQSYDGKQLVAAPAWEVPATGDNLLYPLSQPRMWHLHVKGPPNRIAGWRDSNLTYRSRLTFEV